MSPIEIFAVILGIVNVSLLVRRSVWNYPFGLAMVGLYTVIFYEAALYSNALLQVYFVGVQVYGWHAWLKNRGEDGLVVVETMTHAARLGAGAASVMIAAALGTLMGYLGGAMPFWDATIAALSVTAQFLLARRRLESWIVWIVVDILAIGLYWSQGLHLTAGLYVVFLGLATWGLIGWRKALLSQQTGGSPDSFAKTMQTQETAA